MAAVERRVEPVMRSFADPSVGRVVLFSLRSGTGKTWTARHAMRRAVDSRLFDIVVWVPLSSNSDLRAAQRMIAENLSIPVAGDDGRQDIYSFLDGKKFLMIFDDAWFTEDDALDLIGVPGPNSECLSKVLVTTRSSRTLSVLEPAVVIEPTPLSHKESWSLFSEKAGRPVTSPEVRPLAQAVIDRCAGSPLAIVLVAASMRDVGDDLALRHALENAMSALYYGEDGAVKLGYDTLPRDSMRDCFLYCLLFGKNRSIDAAELVRYWVSEGFIQEYDYLDEAYENGREVLVELVDRCMLNMEDDDHVNMHDVVAEKAASIGSASGKAYFVKVGMELGRLPYSWSNTERMSLMDNKITELPEIPACTSHSLATLLLKGNHSLGSIPDEFFSQMKGLRVLDLSYTAIKRLPPSISELVELRSLLLRGCNSLEEVQHIDVLEKLEILDLSSATSLKTMAYDSCRRMYLLKVLNLSGTSIESLPFLLNLRELRHLYLSHCQLLSSELLQFDFLTKLEVLDLSGTSLLRFPYWMTRLTRLRHLKLGGTKDEAFDWKALQFLPKDFNWHQYGGSDISIELVGNDGEACISVSSADFFRSLDKDSQLWRTCFQKFHFYVCPCIDNDIRFQLKNFALRDTYFESRHFPKSAKPDRYLEVCNLDSYSGGIEGVLKHAELVFLNNNMFMNRLSDLGLENMEVMKECWIERCDRLETVLSREDVQVLAAIGRLEKLWVSNLENLRHLCGEMERPVSLACLKHLHIDCCPELTSLFPSALHLENLETLVIKFCDKLETVFGESVEGNAVLPRLRTLRLWELPQLKSLCQGFLPSVKMIKVKECPKLKKLPLDADNIRPLVEIRGERNWWNSLAWEDERTVCALHFRRGII